MSEESLHELTNESFDDYRQSFSYGSRTDLLFKFLKNGSIEEADQLIRQIFDQAGDLIDTGDPSELIQTITEAQKSAYAGAGHFQYDDKPFTKSAKPVSELNVGLLTTTGHFTEGDDPEPFGMKGLTQDDVVKMTSEFGKADPILSRIPIDTPAEKTLVRHGGYDIRAVERDRNVGLPIDRMRELEADGVIGKFADPAFSFVGLASQLKLRSRLCFEWAQRLKQSGAEAIVLVPIWPVCHVSVGHVARTFEEEGLPNVIIMSEVFKDRTIAMNPPRVLLTRHPMGRPLSAPGDRERQLEVLKAGLELLDSASEGGTVVTFDKPFRHGSSAQ